MLLARLARYEAAIPYFEQIIALVPRDYQAHLFLGHLLQRLGRTDAAENHFKRYSDDQKKYKIERQAWAGLESQIEKLFDGKGRR
jgi:tetratricopeptide (TPR) repeat protein